MSSANPVKSKQLTWLVPLGVVMLYTGVVHWPIARAWSTREDKRSKYAEVLRRRAEDASQATTSLDNERSTVLQLEKELESLRSMGAQLVTTREARRSSILRSQTPALVLSETLLLLQRNQLTCLQSSSLASSTQAETELPLTLKPIVELLGGLPTGGKQRCEVRISLLGRFVNMRAAIHEINAKLPGVMIVGVEMHSSTLQTEDRHWTLIILV